MFFGVTVSVCGFWFNIRVMNRIRVRIGLWVGVWVWVLVGVGLWFAFKLRLGLGLGLALGLTTSKKYHFILLFELVFFIGQKRAFFSRIS